METILVTGGAGFIGSHCVEKLLSSGDRVVVLDNFSTGKRENLAAVQDHERLTIVEGDARLPFSDAVARAVRPEGNETCRVIHLAAQVSVTLSVEDPVADAQANHVATLQALAFASRVKARSFVLASSAAVYGSEVTPPVREDVALAPDSPYGAHKRSSEIALGVHHRVTGLACRALRFFNVYGPRQDPKNPYSGVISIFVDRAHTGKPLHIFGDGEQTRDFVFVEDVVRHVVRASEVDTPGFEIANVGTSVQTSVLQLSQAVIAAAGSQSPVELKPERPGDIRDSWADVSRAKERFGLKSSVSLDDGIAALVASVRQSSGD